MENMKSIVVAGIIILLIIAGGIFFYGKSGLKNTSKNAAITGNTTPKNSSAPTQQVTSGEQDITLTKDGFSPNTITVKVGTLVKWINNSGGVGDVDSDPHPIHTSYPPMNFGQFSNGSSVELVFDKAGTYHYHNHLNPSQKGTIVVK
jgi:plastocyanin